MDLLDSIEGRHYLVTILTEYLSDNHNSEISDMVREAINGSNISRSFVLRIDGMILLQQYPWISPYLLNGTIKFIKLFNAAFTKSFCVMMNENRAARQTEMPNCLIRITNLPSCDEISRTSIPRSVDVDKFLKISATVVRAGPVQVLEFQREYSCKKCGSTMMCEFSESDASFAINPPQMCANTTVGCISRTFVPLGTLGLAPRFCRSRQEVWVQEQVKYLSYGAVPRTIPVVLDDDLVDLVKPGDDVIVNGTVIRRWRSLRQNDECDISLAVLANEIQITNFKISDCYADTEIKQEFQLFWDSYSDKHFTARNAIISQMCPSIYGMYFLKLALALILSGSEHCVLNGMKVRGESHMLLVGDPGTAKSQFLKFAHKITPRSVLTTGIGSTNAGLTVTAVKESNGWSLEAGALVLADGGICCIDEFTSIRECDKVAIHEAMEQQTISVAKAGMVCKLKTRCSVLAATNPKGNYDVTQSITTNTAIASPLLSRFDLIFLLLDNCNESWDLAVSDFILKQQTFENTKDSFNIDRLKTYFTYIRTNFHPKMTYEASVILEKYYTLMRRFETTESLDRITMRFLESLIRLSQSHARLMMRNLVKEEDAVVAVAIMESTVYGSNVLRSDEQLPSSFPSNPEEEYVLLKQRIFSKLSLESHATPNIIIEPSMNNSSLSFQPLIPFSESRIITTQNNKSKIQNLNKSILDNFHISTQVDNNNNNSNINNNKFDCFLDNTLIDDSDVGLTQSLNRECLSSEPIIINSKSGTKRNIFADSITNHAELDDEDFNI